MNFERYEGESREAFILRVYQYKADTGNITNDEAGEICNRVLDECFDESAYRKLATSFLKVWDKVKEEYAPDDRLKEIEEREHQLRLEKIKVQTLNLGLNEKDRYQARRELALEQIRTYIDNLKPIEIPDYKEIQKGGVIAIAGSADEHFGKEVVIEGLGEEPLNVYNEDVFYKRMWNYLNHLIDLIQSEGISKITYFGLSDSIEGILRVSGLQHIKYGIIESSIVYANFMATWLNELSRYVKIDYYACLGNHTEIRPLGSKSGDFAKENMQIVIDEMLKLSLINNDRVTIHKTKAIQYVDIDGYKVLATHGQDEKNLVNSVVAYKEIYDVKVDLMISGHLHNSKQETVSLWTKCVQFPSLIGIDSYSMKLKKTSKAEGKVILVKGKRFINIDIEL